MNRHREILAKSEDGGRTTLFQHLNDVSGVAVIVAKNVGMDAGIAREGALLHDIGKASPIFQSSLMGTAGLAPGHVFRHEIASLFFISLVPDGHRDAIIDMIVAHHKSMYRDIRALDCWILTTRTKVLLPTIRPVLKSGAGRHWTYWKRRVWM